MPALALVFVGYTPATYPVNVPKRSPQRKTGCTEKKQSFSPLENTVVFVDGRPPTSVAWRRKIPRPTFGDRSARCYTFPFWTAPVCTRFSCRLCYRSSTGPHRRIGDRERQRGPERSYLVPTSPSRLPISSTRTLCPAHFSSSRRSRLSTLPLRATFAAHATPKLSPDAWHSLNEPAVAPWDACTHTAAHATAWHVREHAYVCFNCRRRRSGRRRQRPPDHTSGGIWRETKTKSNE